VGRTPPGQTRERILRFMRERLLSGRPPTVREVQRAFGFRAVQTAREHLEALVAGGLLKKEAGRSRGYRLPAAEGAFGTDAPTALVPLLGRVPAGPVDLAVEDLEGYVPVQSSHSPLEMFGLRIRGESMTGAGILPGDIVIVRRQPTANDGDIVVALIEDEATVKRLRRRGRRIELHPENPAFDVIVPEPGRTSLLGKVVEVRRCL